VLRALVIGGTQFMGRRIVELLPARLPRDDTFEDALIAQMATAR
jgi:hypothetical protein